MPTLRRLDAHEKPPEALRLIFKRLQRSTISDLESDTDILLPETYQTEDDSLLIIPSLLTPEIQTVLLHQLLHRDLSNPTHRTNLHSHYSVPYMQAKGGDEGNSTNKSFFSLSPETVFTPYDPSMHKDQLLKIVLKKKLRWMTLGGQYDWTAKEYPDQPPPAFPADIQDLMLALFPDIISQAAIVNLYSPGDVLSMHRDVSEQCDRGLISVSVGCDGLFLMGLESGNGPKHLTLRLRSGDIVCMTGQSRSAWHGVPKVLAGTCPGWLQDWPASNGSTEALECWRGWMSTKRINVNIRQMFSD
ncbi:MAG: hypothetical protein Q9160_000796 [Pyrenula sp. 1 TL-2023]